MERLLTRGLQFSDPGPVNSRTLDLSHGYASRALTLGESRPVIGRLLGHALVGTTAKYTHLVRHAETAAAARTGDSIGAHIMPARAEAA